jgi:hypothetical protein
LDSTSGRRRIVPAAAIVFAEVRLSRVDDGAIVLDYVPVGDV